MNKFNAVAEILRSTLQGIRTQNGFSTDIGNRVFRGRVEDLVDQAPCISLFEDEDHVLAQDKASAATASIRQPYVAEATLPCDPDDPNVAANDAVSDICRALWPDDGIPALSDLLAQQKHLTYAGRQILPRKGGQNVVTVQVKFQAPFVINLGNL